MAKKYKGTTDGDLGGGKSAAKGSDAPTATGTGDMARDGFACEQKFPLTSDFWTKKPKKGQA